MAFCRLPARLVVKRQVAEPQVEERERLIRWHVRHQASDPSFLATFRLRLDSSVEVDDPVVADVHSRLHRLVEAYLRFTRGADDERAVHHCRVDTLTLRRRVHPVTSKLPDDVPEELGRRALLRP